MENLLAFFGFAVGMNGPISIKRLCDEKIFYMRDDGRYESGDDHELLGDDIHVDITWDDIPGYEASYFEDTLNRAQRMSGSF